MWIADKIAYRGEENFVMAYEGSTLVWFKEGTNIIRYTSTDGQIVTPSSSFGANIVSNTYVDGQGIIIFDGPVTRIGIEAFRDCSSLVSITIPSTVTSISIGAFRDCSSLVSINIPSSVTSISSSVFYGCSSLVSITIPSSVTSISSNAFYGCSSLASITIPSSITTIGTSAFRECSSLASITIPSSVTSIGGFVFVDCTSLASVTMEEPSSITTINGLFTRCTSLTSIRIPSSVTYIHNEPFGGCSSLASITVDSNNTTFMDLGSNAIYEYDSYGFLVLVYGCKNTVINNNTYQIGTGAFRYCTGLTSINIPSSVKWIDASAFMESGLTSIDIPATVTNIYDEAFMECVNLTTVTFRSATPPTTLGWDIFDKCTSLTRIRVPSGSVNAYKNEQHLSEYADKIVAI